MVEKKKIGLIAGGGSLPKEIISKNGDNLVVVSLQGFADESIDGKEFNIAKVGAILKYLKKNDVEDIVFAGKVKRPALLSLRPDITGLSLVKKLRGLKNGGDDGFMKAISSFLAERGFNILSVPQVYGASVIQRGNLSSEKPNDEQRDWLKSGFEKAKQIGKLDIGQSLVINENNVVGVEGLEGTDMLIRRCADYATHHELDNKNILIKICKPNQYEKMDLPTIGFKTVENAINNNYAGIAVEADKTLIVEKEKAIELANENGIFLIAL